MSGTKLTIDIEGATPAQRIFSSSVEQIVASRLGATPMQHSTCQTTSGTDPLAEVRPSGWTVSGGGFDRLLGVLILELYGAQISERGV